MSQSSYNDDIRAAFSRSIMQSIAGADETEKGIKVKIIELASNTADRFSEKIQQEEDRWTKQMAQFKADGIDEKHPRWISAQKSHDLVIKVNEKWLDALYKAAN